MFSKKKLSLGKVCTRLSLWKVFTKLQVNRASTTVSNRRSKFLSFKTKKKLKLKNKISYPQGMPFRMCVQNLKSIR